ncbi:MAG TPA: HepT-like ribonuclease domain-containing protein [Acidimicrobiales bacterium]|nr:HepT-like ribonuclease domain-containing protein [Acidimicrobiales bacterium]
MTAGDLDDPATTDAVVASLRESGARFAFVHGSRATGTATPGSDFDVAAWWGTSDRKYRFVTTIEGVVNAAQHLCASEGWGPPKDNGDAVRLVGTHGVVDEQLAHRLVGAVGFRNLLVHQYAEIDDARTVGFLDRIGDIEDFVGQVSTWLDEHAG